MSKRNLAGFSIAAVAGATMLALSYGSVSAMTIPDPYLAAPSVSADIEQVWWHHGWGGGWHHGWGWGGGWHHGWGWGGGWRHCWINRWGYRVCRW